MTCSNPECPHADDPEKMEFYERRKGSGEFHKRCKTCYRAAMHAQYRKHRNKRLARIRDYRLENLEAMREKDRARYEERRERQSAYLSEWRKRNRKKVNEYETRRRARVSGSKEVEKIDRLYVYERDRGLCHVCGRKVDRTSFTLDHLVPLAHGGSHTYENLRVAHRACNSKMGVARLPAQLLLIG